MNPIDKSRELKTSVKLINNKLHFSGTVTGNEPVSIDYLPPLGDNLGYTSLELFLLSLTSCLGSAILTFLRKMNKKILACEIQAHGWRREEHPTGFKLIQIRMDIDSDDVTDTDMLKVIKLAEETYCPVWAMVKGNVEVKVTFTIENNVKH